MRQGLGAVPLLALWLLPFAAGLAMVAGAAADAAAWRALLSHPQLWPALGLSLWTGTAGGAAALICALIIAAGLYRSPWFNRLQHIGAAGLAVPHLAFAIGLGFLIMPSGWLARLLVGGPSPPQWVTVQDPLGLTLAAALALKEVPFFIVIACSILGGDAEARGFDSQWRVARSLGHGAGSIWLRVIQPQLLARMAWPVAIVWAYGCSTADLALVLGPTQPPTLAVLVWHDLNDAARTANGRGMAGGVFLLVVLTALAMAALALVRLAGHMLRRWLARGPSARRLPAAPALLILLAAGLIHVAALAILLLMAASAHWPYPSLWPGSFSADAFRQLAAEPQALSLSIVLGLAVALAGLCLAVLWFETQPRRRDWWVISAALLALVLPQLVSASGHYLLFLRTGLSGTLAGLFLAHLLPATAYVLIVLAGPYRGLDPRFAAVARGLRAGAFRVWWRIKLPLLRGPLAAAAAIGFAVSLVQFVPAQLMASGRWSTLPMEAVTLASGGNRALTAAYALALALPPLAAFGLAGVLGRRRWR